MVVFKMARFRAACKRAVLAESPILVKNYNAHPC